MHAWYIAHAYELLVSVNKFGEISQFVQPFQLNQTKNIQFKSTVLRSFAFFEIGPF
jgi:hypothetical protein